MHRSRLFIFSGVRTPSMAKAENKKWDDSVFQSIYKYLKNYQTFTIGKNIILESSYLYNHTIEMISACTDIPIPKLIDGSIKQYDLRDWYHKINEYRLDTIKPCIDWVITILRAQKLWKSNERPKSYDWTFPALNASDPLRIAKIKLMEAQAKQIYLERTLH